MRNSFTTKTPPNKFVATLLRLQDAEERAVPSTAMYTLPVSQGKEIEVTARLPTIKGMNGRNSHCHGWPPSPGDVS
jgi:hypothetical protein